MDLMKFFQKKPRDDKKSELSTKKETSEEIPQKIYIDFFKRILTDTVYDESIRNIFFKNPNHVSKSQMMSVLDTSVDEESKTGRIFPPPQRAHTMIGLKRLDNIQSCLEDVMKNNIEGDIIETGVWRGGATIFIRMFLKEYNITDKIVYVADSFEGLPKPDPVKYPKDVNDIHHTFDFLKISSEDVQNNFKSYNLLDDQVKILKGWFKDTTQNPPFKKLSILRLDGDMYSSTWEVLENLYDKLSIGGYLIIDDYGAITNCREAVNYFRTKRNIHEPIEQIDWTGIFWKKTQNV
jgi:O-methyltransferase